MKNDVVKAFKQIFGANPRWIVRAPGRVNLIGEHTDYNDGYVFPMAINRALWIALRPRRGDRVIVHSLDFGKKVELDLAGFARENTNWTEYLKGIVWAMRDDGLQLSGWEGVVAGDVPIGSGLSSSAALEIGIARAFSAAADLPWKAVPMAKLAQKAENEWVGVNCGIMDPLISAVAEEGKAALIDCRSLEIEQVLLPEDITVVVMNTMKPRGLVDSAYNERRHQCEIGAQYFGVRALRDVGINELMVAKGRIDPTIYKRTRHVITENERVLQMANMLRSNNSDAAGELMNLSHASLRDDFEVSCEELDQMVEAASGHPGCFGARMTGGGFGGCAVALVSENVVHDFAIQVSNEYQRQTNIEPQFLISAPAQGVEIEILN
jgi:galactokinase